ncbi:hypothetical protein CDL15_Pgr020932 [Punica granatum]|uniref:J domain-containing protein n=1 Tax=Punica granatum TaxID=22663 RepID=A0A218XW07_PUNGR|nr:hypothetical protein CDL15_Pgr020932 [Punica granatum]
MASCTASPYEILGLSSGASSQEIKAAYRRLARVLHPDVVAAGRKEWSASEFIKLHAAYSTLSDPEKRAADERPRAAARTTRRGRPLTVVMPGASAYKVGRNWETDQCW